MAVLSEAQSRVLRLVSTRMLRGDSLHVLCGSSKVRDWAEALIEHYRFLRRVSTALRLLGARPTDTLELAGPMPARVGTALGVGSREAFLTAYRAHTDDVRKTYDEIMSTSHA